MIVEKLYDPEDFADRLDVDELRELFINAVVDKASRQAPRGASSTDTRSRSLSALRSNASRADVGAGVTVGAAERAAAMRERGSSAEELAFAADDSTQLHTFDDMTTSELELKALLLLSRAVNAESSGEGGRHSLVAEAATSPVAHDEYKPFPPAMAFGERARPLSVFAAFAIHLSYVPRRVLFDLYFTLPPCILRVYSRTRRS